MLLLLGPGCSNSGGSGLKFQPPNEYAGRSTGCLDTPFTGADRRSTVQCGREPSPKAPLLRGRVVAETPAGLPGAGLESVGVFVHEYVGGSLDRLPPPLVEARTDPQGAFAVPLLRAGEYVITVRVDPAGPVLAARRIHVRADEAPPELLLLVPP